jgi:hypothetical protein
VKTGGRQNNRPWKAQVQEQRRLFAEGIQRGFLGPDQRARLHQLYGTSVRAKNRIISKLADFDRRTER